MLRVFWVHGCEPGRVSEARGRHYAKLSLSYAPRLSFSDLCILLFLFLSLCRLCVCVFLLLSLELMVDVPLIFSCPADHVPDWQPRVLLGMVEARSVNVKKTTTTTTTQQSYWVVWSRAARDVFFVDGGVRFSYRCSRDKQNNRRLNQLPILTGT